MQSNQSSPRTTRLRVLQNLQQDEAGSISLASVFALLLLVMLLGMVMNSGQQVDQKIKLQNAVDAATWSGGVVLARGMNTLAFTNHLLSDVFALTAVMREARAQRARGLTADILANWGRIGPVLRDAEFHKLDALGKAIIDKVPLEQDLIDTYSDWTQAMSQSLLPGLEQILAEQLIPEFQRALVGHTPRLAQTVADEIAQRHGRSWPRPVELRAVLWRTSIEPVAAASSGALPVTDPAADGEEESSAGSTARDQRRLLAEHYLSQWNDELLAQLDSHGKMSQFSSLWRTFTAGELDQLLEQEYPRTNLPHLIRTPVDEIENLNGHLQQDFMFVGVVYRPTYRPHMPGLFAAASAIDTQAYAQSMLYVPKRRLVLEDDGKVERQDANRHPESWDLLTQNWSLQIVPATSPGIPLILSSEPRLDNFPTFEMPDFRTLTPEQFQWLSNH